MTRHLFHGTILGLVVLTTTTTVGCTTRWIDVIPSPDQPAGASHTVHPQ